MPITAAPALALLAALAAPAHAAPPAACAPVVRDAWVRMTPTMPMGAGYFVLENRCRAPAAVVGADSPDFRDVGMHETRVDGGVSRMRALPRVEIAPGARVAFEPGGRHVMLMGAKHPIAVDGRVRIELRMADGRRLAVDAPVRGAAP